MLLFFHKCKSGAVNVQLAKEIIDLCVCFFFPDDFNRVILSMKRGQEYTDYINASFIDVSINVLIYLDYKSNIFDVACKSF